MIEVRDVRQNPNEYTRRWFSDENSDLIVWYKPDETIEGFELTYDKTGDEKAIRWFADKGFSHYSVDAGEQSPLVNRTPILVAISGKPEIKQVLSCFEASGKDIPVSLAVLIQSKLREYSQPDFQ